MAILKKEYELSIWNEELSSEGIKTEKKGMVIGAHDMDYLGRATNIKLKREIKGTNTLTFDMPVKYFDSHLGEYVKNEFIDDLYNEQKLKLNYNGRWYEFYIKSISEKKQFKSIVKSFTCQDSFIDELSRTGYEILIDEQVYNSVDEITLFMEEILEDSIWDYRADFNWGDFTEFKEERFYKIPLEQFGGSIKGYPIRLSISISDLKAEEYKNLSDKEKEEKLTITNVYTKENRSLELGDDLSHQYEIFWDPHNNSNGFDLLSEGAEELIGGYIYVPYSDLSFIYGSIYEDPYKSTEEPATYGPYGTQKGFALQPSSKDSTDFIQFIYFKDDDEVLVDESGTIANNNCHYLISIEDWNNMLKQQFNGEAAIHWTSPMIEEANGITETEKYKTAIDGEIKYTTNALPSSSTIDDFTWYPVYYEGYLSEINETEVFAARKISITNRTEFNLKAEYYTTIYNNDWKDYSSLYSEEIPNEEIDFRVQSMEETRIITPTLARNLITNGTEITSNDGWETLVQNDQTEYNTGSYANLLEISVKSTTQNDTSYNPNGSVIDEEISDYYLELLSPNVDNCNDFAAEGSVVGDYALNFGLTELENGIEKDKVYAIRICTGAWVVDDYTIVFRTKDEAGEDIVNNNCTERDAQDYENALITYNNALNSNEIGLTINDTEQEFKDLLLSWISDHDAATTSQFEKWINVYTDDDWRYLVGRINDEETSEYPILEDNAHERWSSQCIYKNQSFIKSYNTDLDRVYIAQGSIDINGNYELSGINNNGTDYISFKDVFEVAENVSCVGRDGVFDKKQVLTKTYYHNKVNGNWIWEEAFSKEDSVEDNAFLLFKAKTNIKNPYLGIYIESQEMQVSIDKCQISLYKETDTNGIKFETLSINEKDGKEYYVENAVYRIYEANSNNFSSDYLKELGLIDDSRNVVTNPSLKEDALNFKDGYLLNTASPIWTANSTSAIPLFFTLMENPIVNEERIDNRSNLYVLFINDIYYGVFWLEKNKDGGDE